tara:strand:- start:2916 stop:3368 length:453 start_codon:yes stop_codon:yes gene_type:complete
MYWITEDLLSALAFGTAYTATYFSVSLHDVSSVAFGAAVKFVGFWLVLAMVGYQALINSNVNVIAEISRLSKNWSSVLTIGICSVMWYAAEITLYEAQKISKAPANATAIWNLSPLPVFLLSVLLYKRKVSLEQYIGIGVIVLAVFLINM